MILAACSVLVNTRLEERLGWNALILNNIVVLLQNVEHVAYTTEELKEMSRMGVI